MPTAIRVGQAADLKIPDLPSKTFNGTVTRTANALDPATRTLLAEVQVPNESGLLLPGMYSEVNFTTPRAEPPLMIRADALVVRGDGIVCGCCGSATMWFISGKSRWGGIMATSLEVLGGLKKGERVVISPGDVVRENAKVNPIEVKNKG